MARVRFTRRAREDLLEIWDWIASENLTAADRVYDLIAARCETLQAHPAIGRARPEIAADARAIVIERWIALYRIIGGDAQIVRVIDGARDIAAIEWTPE